LVREANCELNGKAALLYLADVSEHASEAADEIFHPSVSTLWRIKLKPIHGLIIYNLAAAAGRH
jgi:hypothetical protein